MTPAGFPHSEILGSKPACGSPRLIAANHVLHRFPVPRHPPCTLSSLTKLKNLSDYFSANPFAINPIQLSKIRGSTLSRTAGVDCIQPLYRAPKRVEYIFQKNLSSRAAGGADRFRTDDLRLAKAALSQLSYSPRTGLERPTLVGLGRFELPTSRLSGVRSNQLSYRPRQETRPIPWKLNREESLRIDLACSPLAAIDRSRPRTGEAAFRKEVIQPRIFDN